MRVFVLSARRRSVAFLKLKQRKAKAIARLKGDSFFGKCGCLLQAIS
jgi:hypothetical protein